MSETWTPEALEVSVTPKAVYLGDPLTYRVEFERPLEVRLELPPQLDLAPFTVRDFDRGTRPLEDDAGTVRETWTLTLALYELDATEVPALEVPVRGPDGPAVLRLDAQPVEVRSLVAEEGQGPPRELSPPEPVWVTDLTLVWAALAVLAALAAAWLLWRRRRARPARPAAPPLPLEARTVAALTTLQKRRLAEAGRHRELFFGLSGILRGYLGERYGFDALECTASELLETLEARRAPGLDLDRLGGWVALTERVKFARYVPEAHETTGAFSTAFDLVRETSLAHRWEQPEGPREDAA